MTGRKPLLTHLKLVKRMARPHRVNREEPGPAVDRSSAAIAPERARPHTLY
jgi:hypothetical protein